MNPHHTKYAISRLELGLAIVLILIISESTAHAYIDPGTGSMVLQVLVGLLLAGLLTIKRWWHFLTGFFRRKSDDESTGEN